MSPAPSPVKAGSVLYDPARRYRTAFDPASEHVTNRLERASLLIVPCARGHMYVHGDSTLAYTGNTAGWRARLLAIPGVKAHQTGDVEFTVTFPVSALDAVAEVVKPKKKRTGGNVANLRPFPKRGQARGPERLGGPNFNEGP